MENPGNRPSVTGYPEGEKREAEESESGGREMAETGKQGSRSRKMRESEEPESVSREKQESERLEIGSREKREPESITRKNGPERKRGGLLPGVCSALSVFLLLLVVAICIPMTVPRLFGYEAYTVVSGSMEPAIPVGSAIYLKAAVPEEIAEGDVIAFYKGRAVVTHRVVENRKVSGEFITKGDANAEKDMEPVPYSALIGRMAVSVPGLGAVMAVCTGTLGKAYLAGGVAGALFLQLLGSRLRRT